MLDNLSNTQERGIRTGGLKDSWTGSGAGSGITSGTGSGAGGGGGITVYCCGEVGGCVGEGVEVAGV